jgi:hypothetical protein
LARICEVLLYFGGFVLERLQGIDVLGGEKVVTDNGRRTCGLLVLKLGEVEFPLEALFFGDIMPKCCSVVRSFCKVILGIDLIFIAGIWIVSCYASVLRLRWFCTVTWRYRGIGFAEVDCGHLGGRGIVIEDTLVLLKLFVGRHPGDRGIDLGVSHTLELSIGYF